MDGERCQVTEGRARGQLLGLWLSATRGGTEREATAAPGQAPSAFLPGRGVSRTGLLPTWRKVLNVSSFSSGTLALVAEWPSTSRATASTQSGGVVRA